MNKRKHYLAAILMMSAFVANAQEVVTVYDTDGESEEIEMPDGMTVEADTLLSDYSNREGLIQGSATVRELSYDDSLLVNRLAHIPTTIEMPLNNVTRKFIDQYCNRLKSSVSVMLGSANFYMPIFEEALEAYNVPLELKYLPVIESALRPAAVSRAGAVGLWQFIMPTAKRYGLEINTLVDERRDPIKSSYAAAHYLRDLYDRFGDWGLAIAAYNCGEGAVGRALLRAGSEGADYWTIYSKLPKETRGYVPAFIAANYIMNYYCEHGIVPMEATMPIETDTIVVTDEVNFNQIAQKCNVSVDMLRALNPQYRRDIVPMEYVLRMPQEAIEAFILNEDSIYNLNVDNTAMRRRVTEDVSEGTSSSSSFSSSSSYKKSRTTSTRSKSHSRSRKRSGTRSISVRSGDTLSAIAKRNNTTVSNLRKLNKISGSKIRPGQKVRIK